ncbi:MAG: histidine kinase [Alistipes sp.]|jgi:signal transduction histidine kinase|nr:histidine kinase [Alistipes sp.]
MAVKILLIVSILLQLLATVVAIRLVSKTKYNSIWILFFIALLLMTASRALQFVHFVPRGETSPWLVALIWFDIAISVCLTVVLFNARLLVEYIDRLIFRRGLTSKRILSTVLRTEEKERARFSKELHDGLGPLLSSAKMSLSVISAAGISDSNAEILAGTRFVIDEAVRSLREISNNLSPHVLGEFGLARGVGNFIGRLGAIHDVGVNYTTNLVGERFDTDVEVILYRVICELVNNSLKHSGAGEIVLRLELSPDGLLRLDYRDDGCGFDPSMGSVGVGGVDVGVGGVDAAVDAAVGGGGGGMRTGESAKGGGVDTGGSGMDGLGTGSSSGSGMGLINIASRINALNGRLDIRSSREGGMQAIVEVRPGRDPQPIAHKKQTTAR